MNRREFIKGLSALAILGLLPGCSKTKAEDSALSISGPGGLSYRKNAALGVKVSLLGYGLMRMPEKEDGSIDTEKGLALIDRAHKAGINYYDTAWFYHDGNSELFAGEALSRYPRDSYYLASKLPMRILESVEQAKETFSKQLEKCRVDYFDFYLFHNFNGPLWKKSLELGLIDYGVSLKESGKVKRLGFSFHGDNRDYKEILNYRKWDFVQIQANYLDWQDFAREQYEEAEKLGIPVIIMEPLKGGALASLRSEAEEVLKKAKIGSTPAQWAFRFIAEKPGVLTVLSGMTEMAHLEENIKTFSPLAPLNDSEQETLWQALETHKTAGIPPCTTCRYCMPCPAGVAIPDIFKIYREYREGGSRRKAKEAYAALGKDAQGLNCVECGACLKKCPQEIKIPENLKRIHKELS